MVSIQPLSAAACKAVTPRYGVGKASTFSLACYTLVRVGFYSLE